MFHNKINYVWIKRNIIEIVIENIKSKLNIFIKF